MHHTAMTDAPLRPSIAAALVVLAGALAGGPSRAPAAECLTDFDPAPYASGCGSVQLTSAPVRGGDTLTVQVFVGEAANGPCGVGGHAISASYALDTVLVDGVPVIATEHGDAGTYGYGSPSIAPVSGPVIPISPGQHTVVFTLHANTPDDCVHSGVGSFSGDRWLGGPWVILSQYGGRWSTPVPFVTESASACGDGVIDPANEECDPARGACNLECQCESTCGNRQVEWPCEECDEFSDGCSACRCTNRCGNARVEPPCESCDLGQYNGVPGSGCSSQCQATGICSGTGAACATMADCPEGEHCCGNGRYELGEECDDGNRFDLDCCSSTCREESTGEWGKCDDDTTSCTSSAQCPSGQICHARCVGRGCSAMGPHLVRLSSRFAGLLAGDPNDPNRIGLWASKGSFNIPPGARFQPNKSLFDFDLDWVVSPILLPSWCPPASSCFSAGGEACPKRWVFRDPNDLVFQADDLAVGKFIQEAKPTGGCRRRIRFVMQSNEDARASMPRSSRIRHTIEVGDVCATSLVDCTTIPDVGVSCRSVNR